MDILTLGIMNCTLMFFYNISYFECDFPRRLIGYGTYDEGNIYISRRVQKGTLKWYFLFFHEYAHAKYRVTNETGADYYGNKLMMEFIEWRWNNSRR